ncbi:MAG: type II toxin-antitoxin system HipA family toxin [Phycicoccus sp.]
MAKFPSAAHDTWNVMAWEKVALELAARAGITVPTNTLLNLAGRSILVVDRFDRTGDADGGPAGRIGYVSAMTMLQSTDGQQGSYLEIAETIETRSSHPTADLRQLWRRTVFSILISNTDDHLRNHGFLHQDGDAWRLSPAFDVNPNPQPGAKHLSTAIDLGDDTASISLALAVADYFRLGAQSANDIVAQVRTAVSDWAAVARQHGLVLAGDHRHVMGVRRALRARVAIGAATARPRLGRSTGGAAGRAGRPGHRDERWALRQVDGWQSPNRSSPNWCARGRVALVQAASPGSQAESRSRAMSTIGLEWVSAPTER